MGSSSAGIADLHAANNADGSLSVFGIGNNGDIWFASQNAPGVGWSNWTDMSGEQIQPGFVVGRNLTGQLEVFGADGSGNVWDNIQTASCGWNGWSALRGDQTNSGRPGNGWRGDDNGGNFRTVERVNPRLAVARNLDGRLELFGIGHNSHVWYISQQTPGGGWGHWQDLGGDNIDPQLVVGNTADGRIQLFGIGRNQDVWSDWQSTSSGWSGWSDFGGKGITFYPGQTQRPSGWAMK